MKTLNELLAKDERLCELDEWLAVNVFGWTQIGRTWSKSWKAGQETRLMPPAYTRDPRSFQDIKREIERRGWSWQAQSPIGGAYYRFAIFAAKEHDLAPYVPKIGEGVGESEEIAGCLAFKAAVEAKGLDVLP